MYEIVVFAIVVDLWVVRNGFIEFIQKHCIKGQNCNAREVILKYCTMKINPHFGQQSIRCKSSVLK